MALDTTNLIHRIDTLIEGYTTQLSKAEAIIARVRAAIARPVMCGPNAIPSVPVAAIHSALEGEA